MAELNKVLVIGNLTKDPEIINVGNSTVANFRVAINRTWKDSEGKSNNDVCFKDVKAWGKNAETISKFCKKGKALLIEGRLTMDTWDAKDGSGKRNKDYITLESFQFLGTNGNKDAADESKTIAASAAPPVVASADVNGDNYDGVTPTAAKKTEVVVAKTTTETISESDLQF